ncbi:MAG: hypothetical protein ABI597_06780 [Gammaproteobacteria bacterium]
MSKDRDLAAFLNPKTARDLTLAMADPNSPINKKIWNELEVAIAQKIELNKIIDNCILSILTREQIQDENKEQERRLLETRMLKQQQFQTEQQQKQDIEKKLHPEDEHSTDSIRELLQSLEADNHRLENQKMLLTNSLNNLQKTQVAIQDRWKKNQESEMKTLITQFENPQTRLLSVKGTAITNLSVLKIALQAPSPLEILKINPTFAEHLSDVPVKAKQMQVQGNVMQELRLLNFIVKIDGQAADQEPNPKAILEAIKRNKKAIGSAFLLATTQHGDETLALTKQALETTIRRTEIASTVKKVESEISINDKAMDKANDMLKELVERRPGPKFTPK